MTSSKFRQKLLAELPLRSWQKQDTFLFFPPTREAVRIFILLTRSGPGSGHERLRCKALSHKQSVTVCLNHFDMPPYLKPVLQQRQCEVRGTHG